MKSKLMILALLVALNLKVSAKDKPLVFVLDANTLAANKSKIDSKDAGIMPAYKNLLKEAEKAMAYGPVSVMEKKHVPPSGDKHDFMSLAPYHWPDPSKPNGLPYMRKDGETNPEVKEYKDKEYLPEIGDKVYKLALAYYFSDESRYANHAAELMRVWFLNADTKMNPNLNYAQAIKGENEGRGAGMIDARHLQKVIDAIGLIKADKNWTAADQQGMVTWFGSFLNWMQTSPNGKHELNAPNNHGDWYDALRLSIALFLNDTELAKKIVVSAQDRLDKQMNDQGRLPLEMERTTSLHYSVFAMHAFFNIAHMAEKIGMDFWNYQSPSGKSLKKGFNELLPYLAKQKEWDGQQIKEFNHEEGLELLKDGKAKMGCKKCPDYISDIAGDKAPRLLIKLTN